jgi:hypothetical protein
VLLANMKKFIRRSQHLIWHDAQFLWLCHNHKARLAFCGVCPYFTDFLLFLVYIPSFPCDLRDAISERPSTIVKLGLLVTTSILWMGSVRHSVSVSDLNLP